MCPLFSRRYTAEARVSCQSNQDGIYAGRSISPTCTFSEGFRNLLFLGEEHRVKVFGNWVLMKIFGSKRDEVTGEWRRLHKEGVYYLFASQNINRVFKSRRMRWTGHGTRMGERRGAHRGMVGEI